MLETIFVLTIFLCYAVLWKVKQIRLMRESGIDVQVIQKSTSNVQQYFSRLTSILSLYMAISIIAHSLNFQIGSLFTRIDRLSSLGVDITGLLVGLTGLSLCLYAQIKMGSSWRVGIDEKNSTELVTNGLYQYIRNPTYLGLFAMNLGIWLIWPTWSVFFFAMFFIFFLEVQVRCEEDYLTAVHGIKYVEYKKRTKRYVPFIY